MSKIVLVEDEQMLADMYKISLDHEGFETHVAYNGKIGLELIEQVKPDLALLDLMLPELSGADILEAMRKSSWGKKIKVIILTNISEYEAPPDLHKLGFERYIVKANHTLDQVIDIVHDVLDDTAEVKSVT